MKNCECGEESTVRFWVEEKQVCLCNACWEPVKAKLSFGTQKRLDLFKRLNQASDQIVERGRVKEISADARAQWRNIWCVLRSLDLHELNECDSPHFDYAKFRDEPHRYLIRTDDRQADAIWRAVEKRLK